MRAGLGRLAFTPLPIHLAPTHNTIFALVIEVPYAQNAELRLGPNALFVWGLRLFQRKKALTPNAGLA